MAKRKEFRVCQPLKLYNLSFARDFNNRKYVHTCNIYDYNQ